MSEPRALLPTHVQPLHYSLEIFPDLQTFKYSGTVKIRLKVLTETQTLVCHGKELELDHVSVQLQDRIYPSIKIQHLEEEIWMDFDHWFQKDDELELNLTFRGIHNDQLSGFYRSGYMINGEKK
jgi:aminopeptidase 2